MLIKAGVDISRLNPEIRGVLGKAQVILHEFADEIVVTSTYEGNHMEGSYHYANDAFDFTGRYFFKDDYGQQLRNYLINYFDVVIEADHIHVEFDRRKFNAERRS